MDICKFTSNLIKTLVSHSGPITWIDHVIWPYTSWDNILESLQGLKNTL